MKENKKSRFRKMLKKGTGFVLIVPDNPGVYSGGNQRWVKMPEEKSRFCKCVTKLSGL